MTRSLSKLFVWLLLFAVAMGFLESAVVIYLREIYYPMGFRFPLVVIPAGIATVEFLRECATVVMLLAAGIMAGRTPLQRFAFFVLAFAVWDLCYYVFLYLCTGWPESLFTWDILFLVPVPWVGPVWAPCVLALLMAVGSVAVILAAERSGSVKLSFCLWLSVIAGALVCILAFTEDYLQCCGIAGASPGLLNAQGLFSDFSAYVPDRFNTPLFLCGFILMLLPVILFIRQTLKTNHHEKK